MTIAWYPRNESLGFNGTTVLIVGDVMLDEYVSGPVRRISPEAPVPVVEVASESCVLGGAANAAAGITALGGTALLAGVVGKDRPADRLRDCLEEFGIPGECVVADTSRPTTTKTRVLDGSRQVVRVDRESCVPLGEKLESQLLDWITTHLHLANAVIISDYAKGVVSARLAGAVISAASERAIPTVVDPKGRDFTKYRGATVVTPNVEETERATGRVISDEAGLCEAGRALLETVGDIALLITRGPLGMSLFTEAGAGPVHIPATARRVFDVTGAGDTVVAVLALALATGAPISDAARLAGIAAGIVVTKVGTATVTAAELWPPK